MKTKSKAKMNLIHSLSVEYPLDKYKWGSLDPVFRKLVKQSESGGGTGFGVRDLSFYFKTKTQAASAKKRVDRLHLASVRTNVRSFSV